MLRLLVRGLSADFAFFMARRTAVLFEIARGRLAVDAAVRVAEDAMAHGGVFPEFSALLSLIGRPDADPIAEAPHALSFTLVGGFGELLV